jgi:ATP-dependent Clp protease ATP-binding subunit ClpA
MLNEDLSGRRFTTSAIHIVEQLWARAADRSISSELNEQTAPMLTLWALLRWERKVGLVAIERLGIEPDSLAQAVNKCLSATCDEIRGCAGRPEFKTFPSGQKVLVVDFNAPLEPLLATAEQEAKALGHDWVGSEHLLLGVIQKACPRLRQVLDAHGISHDRVKGMIVELLRN